MCVKNNTVEKYFILGCFKFPILDKDDSDNYRFQKVM